jgi:hypothetical protein
MLTSSLMHLAVLVYFSLSLGHGIGNTGHIHAGKTPAAKVGETVELGGSAFREKLGLESEPAVRPDNEVAAFQSSLNGLKSVPAFHKQIATQAPEKLPAASHWKKRFFLVSDGNKGVYFDGKFFPMINEINETDGFRGIVLNCPEPPVKCVLLSPTEFGVEDAHGIAFKADPDDWTSNDFYDANRQIFSFFIASGFSR